jgi:hypothetical protein
MARQQQVLQHVKDGQAQSGCTVERLNASRLESLMRLKEILRNASADPVDGNIG